MIEFRQFNPLNHHRPGAKQQAMERASLPKRRKAAQAGYGLMLLIVFITSTVLIGTSMQMVLGSGAASYMGTTSQDSIAAKELAMSGMETVLADIQSKLNSNTSVTTAYTYSSTNITMPTNPASLGGGTTTIGSFSATMTAARGTSYLVKVVATVGNASYAYSKILNMGNVSNTVIDSLTGGGVNAAYSLRKLRTAYSGSAIRVRRSSDNTEQDIGFDGNGNLDLDSLKTFISANTLPLNQVSGATVAYGLRRLLSTYRGYAINVRRSSDSTSQDIGFTSGGDLDIASLMNFVGDGTGYVTKWYDQSGSGYDASQGTTGYQPTIVKSGVLNTVNNRPIIIFDGSDDTLQLGQAVYNDITIMAVYQAISCPGSSGDYAVNTCRIINSDKGGVANDFTVGVDSTGSAEAFVGNPDTTSGLYAKGQVNAGDNKLHWLDFQRDKSSGRYKVYNDMSSYWDSNGNTNSLSDEGAIFLSWNANMGLSEVLMYNSGLSKTNRLALERNEAWYFNLYPYWIGWTLPLNISGMPSAYGAYSLRKVRSAYGGYAINVRRSSDNATQDIGFDSTATLNLDVKSLMSFVGSGTGYVTKWYDQSGYGKDLSQATAAKQPIIVNAGSMVLDNGRPALQFNASNGVSLSGAAVLPAGQAQYSYAAFAGTSSSGSSQDLMEQDMSSQTTNRRACLSVEAGHSNYGFIGEYNDNWDIVSANLGNASNSIIMTQDSSQATNLNMYLNGGLTGSGATSAPASLNLGNSAFAMGYRYYGNDEYWNGTVSEAFVFPSVLSSSNIRGLAINQLFYYNPPPPAVYVTKWYDQSGNGNDLVNTNVNLQPTLLMHPYGSTNNRPTVLFNGAQYLYNTSGMPTSADYSKVAVFSYFGVGSSGTTYGTNNIISSTVNMHAFYLSASPNISLFHAGTFATASSAGGFNMSAGINYASTGTYTESSKTGTVYVFNQSAGTGTTATSNTDAGIQLGAHSGLDHTMYGTISEALIFSRVLNSIDRQAIYNDERGYFGAQ